MALTVTSNVLKYRESPSDPWQRLLIQANINFNLIYPVGSIYMSTVNVNPGTIFGGTWEQIKDVFLLSCGDTYANGATGGEATHKLTVSEMPSHYHKFKDWLSRNTSNGSGAYCASYSQQADIGGGTRNEGGDQPHNNMPPYLAVYVWKRTA